MNFVGTVSLHFFESVVDAYPTSCIDLWMKATRLFTSSLDNGFLLVRRKTVNSPEAWHLAELASWMSRDSVLELPFRHEG